MVLEVYVIIGSLVIFLTENNIPKSMNTDRHLIHLFGVLMAFTGQAWLKAFVYISIKV